MTRAVIDADAVSDAADVGDVGPHDGRSSRSVSLRTIRNFAVVAVAIAVVAVLAVYGYQRYASAKGADSVAADRQRTVLAARTEVLALTTVSAKSSQADIKRLLAGATPEFRDQFQQQAQAFVTALKEADVTSTGSIASAGIESMKGDTAVVLVAATGTVKNKNTDKAEPRNYRLRVTLNKSSGKWLVSGMDFVA
jgi:Mce-associated membrane protein